MLPFTRPSIGADEIEGVTEVLESGWITTGSRAHDFEAALGEYLGGSGRVLAVSSGTAALELALLAAGIGPGDQVIVPAMSFVASANAIVRTGAEPVFVDVDLDTRNITPDRIAAVIGEKTRAIMPVHFAGLPVDLDGIFELAQRHGLRIVEDAAHAIGSRYHGHPIGSHGDFVCFSFHPNKTMTTIEGGAVVCFEPAAAGRIETLRFHGIRKDERGGIEVSEWGGKMNFPDVNAAVGLAQLPKLDGWIERRRELALLYRQALPEHPALHLPADGPGHSWNMFAVRVEFDQLGMDRYEFQQQLRRRGVDTGTHFPPIHLFELYRGMGGQPGDHPNAETIGAQTLTLPFFPAMNDEAVRTVADSIAALLPGG